MTACNQPTVVMGTGWGVGLDSGDDAPQGRECDLSSNTMKASRAQQGFAPRLERPTSLVWSSHSAGYNHEESYQGPLAAEVVY